MNLKRILTTSGIGLICLSMISLIPSNADRLPYEVKDIFNLKEDILLGASSKDYDLNNDDNINILDLIQMKQEVLTQETQTDNKVLIVYYSLPKGDTIDSDGSASRVYIDGQTLGSVQYMAQTIQETTGGDIFQIEIEEEYPNNYDDLIAQAKDEQNTEYRPTLTTHIDNIQDYDTIFIGYPNWWGDMPMALYSFFDEYDLSGKTIIPFNTHGGSGFSNTINTISTLEPNATVIQNGLTMSRDNISSYENEVSSWINSLNL